MQSNSILVSHPTGNANVRGILGALSTAGTLRAFHTAVSYDPTAWWAQLLPAKIRMELARRRYSVPKSLVHTWPLRELTRLVASRLGITVLQRHEHGWASIDAIYRDADRHVAAVLHRYSNLKAVYAYEDGARATFLAAERLGIRRLYELPIGYWRYGRDLMEEEAALQPAWASTLTGNLDSSEKLNRKDEELALADAIYVASSFTRKTLQYAELGARPIHVIPYGAPHCADGSAAGLNGNGRLRVLFVGALGQRKGTSYLLDAVKRLGSSVDVTLIGTAPRTPPAQLVQAMKNYRYIPTLANSAVLQEMRQHDVLVFPSLFEGFGLVLLEAMAQGLPVITTAHTAGPDLIEDGIEGFIVPIRSADAIAEKLALLHSDQERLKSMGTAALLRARSISWQRYAVNLMATL